VYFREVLYLEFFLKFVDKFIFLFKQNKTKQKRRKEEEKKKKKKEEEKKKKKKTC
jgi:hypothetical protein